MQKTEKQSSDFCKTNQISGSYFRFV